MNKPLLLFASMLLSALSVFSQEPTSTPPADQQRERVVTEEIKLNVGAFDANGRFVANLKKEDLVIMEDGRLHQAKSVRLIPASVLVAMDTGGEIRQKKNIATTRRVAENLVHGLNDGTEIALLNFHDRVEFISEWTKDRDELIRAVRSRTNFGRRGSFTEALNSAIAFFKTAPTQNRHLILITDGLDSADDSAARVETLQRVWQSGIVVHVISYTQIEFEALKPQARIWREGEPNPRRMPDEVMEALAAALPLKRQDAREYLKQIYPPRLFSIVTDVPFIRNRNSQLKRLTISHLQLSAMAEYSGGLAMLPETLDDMVEKAAAISSAINGQYVVTYEPRRLLKEAGTVEIRQIEVTSRRADVRVEGSRRLVVNVQ